MTRETLEKAIEVRDSIDALYELQNIFEQTFPPLSQMKTSNLDEGTLVRWKHMNKEFIEERIYELEEELREL